MTISKTFQGNPNRVFSREFYTQILLVHLVALTCAPVLFTWQAFGLAWGATMVFGYALGIFHHMLLTHDSFATKRWVKLTGALLGTLSWRGPMASPIRYVAMHRVHHAFADKDPDPHSPIHGRFHSVIGWMWNLPKAFLQTVTYDKIAGRMAEDSLIRFMDRHPHLLQFFWGMALFLVGGFSSATAGAGWVFDWENAARFVVYGVFVKTLLVLYLAGAVDLINHGVGYRNYETDDLSTNSALMGAIHLGGAISWHNNHHAHPAYFTVKAKWWEFDAHYLLVKALSYVGLTWDIKEKMDVDHAPSAQIQNP